MAERLPLRSGRAHFTPPAPSCPPRLASRPAPARLSERDRARWGRRPHATRRCDSLTDVSSPRENLLKVCSDIIAPLVHADGGELFVVSIDEGSIALHLAGKCAGCPGATLTSASIIEPAIHAVAPQVRVTVTSGFHVPDGASVVMRKEVA